MICSILYSSVDSNEKLEKCVMKTRDQVLCSNWCMKLAKNQFVFTSGVQYIYAIYLIFIVEQNSRQVITSRVQLIFLKCSHEKLSFKNLKLGE